MQPVKSMLFSSREHGSDRPEIRRHLGGLGGAHPQRRAPRRQVEAAGHDLVVVPSAMAGETDRLIALAKEIQALPDPRELDVVAATGEQVTIGLLAMALMDLGVKARSYTGWQAKIGSEAGPNKARIVSIEQVR